MAIIVEQIDKSGHILRLDKIAGATVSLGRGFDNDVILIDPSVDAYHCLLSWDETAGQLNAQDLGALNGLWTVDKHHKKRRVLAVGALQSGHTLLVGRTLVRVYHSSHPVPAAKPVQLDEFITGFFGHMLVVAVLAIIAIMLDVWNQYLDNPTGQNYAEFGRQAFYGVLGVVVYSGFWALLGKNLLQDGRFWFHLSVSFAALILWMLWEWFVPWAMFNFQIPREIALGFNKIFNGLLAGGAIYIACLYATRLSLKPRLAIAAILPLVIITPVLAKLFDKKEFNERPDYSHVLVAPDFQWRDPRPVEQFMDRAQTAYYQYDPATDLQGTGDVEASDNTSEDNNENPREKDKNDPREEDKKESEPEKEKDKEADRAITRTFDQNPP